MTASTTVLSVHTIKPLDTATLAKAARETGGIVTVEEHTVDGGLGGAVAEMLLEGGTVPGCFHRIGLRSGFSSIVGSQKYLRTRYGIDRDAIAAKVQHLLTSGERMAACGTFRFRFLIADGASWD